MSTELPRKKGTAPQYCPRYHQEKHNPYCITEKFTASKYVLLGQYSSTTHPVAAQEIHNTGNGVEGQWLTGRILN